MLIVFDMSSCLNKQTVCALVADPLLKYYRRVIFSLSLSLSL